MPYVPRYIEVKLTFYYHGLKATQYFSKTSPETEKVFLDDLFALRFPQPRRANISLVSFGCMECVWPSVEKNAVLHQHVLKRINPPSDFRDSVQKLLEKLSIANITAKFRDLKNSHTDQISFKRAIDEVEDFARDDRPLKKAKVGRESADAISHSFSKDRQSSTRTSPKKTKLTLSSVFELPSPKPPSDRGKPPNENSHSINSRSLSTSLKRPLPADTSTVHTTSESSNITEIPQNSVKRENGSRWDKPPDSKPPPFTFTPTEPIFTKPTATTPSTSSNASASTSTLPPRPSATLPNSTLPPRPNKEVTPPTPVQRQSRFGPPAAPVVPMQYSPRTLAEFAKEYTKNEPISPTLFARVPSPPPLPVKRTQPEREDGGGPREALRGWQIPVKGKDKETARKATESVLHWGRDEKGKEKDPRPTRINGKEIIRDVEMRDSSRSSSDRKRGVDSNGSNGATSSNTYESALALAEIRGRLAKVEVELAEERRRRRAAEDAIADIRRECRAPFVVPSLVDAFMELSRFTTIATTTPAPGPRVHVRSSESSVEARWNPGAATPIGPGSRTPVHAGHSRGQDKDKQLVKSAWDSSRAYDDSWDASRARDVPWGPPNDVQVQPKQLPQISTLERYARSKDGIVVGRDSRVEPVRSYESISSTSASSHSHSRVNGGASGSSRTSTLVSAPVRVKEEPVDVEYLWTRNRS